MAVCEGSSGFAPRSRWSRDLFCRPLAASDRQQHLALPCHALLGLGGLAPFLGLLVLGSLVLRSLALRSLAGLHAAAQRIHQVDDVLRGRGALRTLPQGLVRLFLLDDLDQRLLVVIDERLGLELALLGLHDVLSEL